MLMPADEILLLAIMNISDWSKQFQPEEINRFLFMKAT